RGAEILCARIRFELTVASAEQTPIFGADPERAIVVFEYRAHRIAAGAVSDMNSLEAIRRAAIQAANIRGCPQRAVVANLQCANRGIRQTLLASEGPHAAAGDFEQRRVGADPDVTVVIGSDGANVAITQARFVECAESSPRERDD